MFQTLKRNWFLILMAVGAAFAAMALAEPEAHADTNSYLNRLEAAGYYGPVWKWNSIGQYVCDAEARGQDPNIIVRSIYNSTGFSVGVADAWEIKGIADAELCGFGAYVA